MVIRQLALKLFLWLDTHLARHRLLWLCDLVCDYDIDWTDVGILDAMSDEAEQEYGRPLPGIVDCPELTPAEAERLRKQWRKLYDDPL